MPENNFIEAKPKIKILFIYFIVHQVVITKFIFPLVNTIPVIETRYLCFFAVTCLAFWPAAFYFLYEAKKAIPFGTWPAVNASLPFRTKKTTGFYAKINGLCVLFFGIVFLLLPLLWVYAWNVEKKLTEYQLQFQIRMEEENKRYEKLEQKMLEKN